jgi:hypothetical protein
VERGQKCGMPADVRTRVSAAGLTERCGGIEDGTVAAMAARLPHEIADPAPPSPRCRCASDQERRATRPAREDTPKRNTGGAQDGTTRSARISGQAFRAAARATARAAMAAMAATPRRTAR